MPLFAVDSSTNAGRIVISKLADDYASVEVQLRRSEDDTFALLRTGSCQRSGFGRAYHLGSAGGAIHTELSFTNLRNTSFAVDVDLTNRGRPRADYCAGHRGTNALRTNVEVMRTTRPPASGTRQRWVVSLSPSGTAVLSAEPRGRTRVSLEVAGGPSGGMAAHIRPGTCRSLTRGREFVLAHLTNDERGDHARATTVVSVTLNTLIRGRYSIEVHTSAYGADVDVCGDI